MSGIGQQLPALVGVVIGVLASFLAGAASERTRWRRERFSRFAVRHPRSTGWVGTGRFWHWR